MTCCQLKKELVKAENKDETIEAKIQLSFSTYEKDSHQAYIKLHPLSKV